MRNPSQVLLLALVMASLILPPVPTAMGASARSDGARPRRILLVGDSLSVGLGKQLDTILSGRADVRFAHLGKVSSGLANPAFFDWDAHLTSQVRMHHPDVVLIMVGANDDKPLSGPGGGPAAFGTRDWDAGYAARLAGLYAIIRADNPRAHVYYIGVPVMGDPAFNKRMIHVNAVIAKTASGLTDATFIDVRATLADPSGAYARMGRAPDGEIVKLRADDGVHISGTGSRLLAARCLEVVAPSEGLPRRALLASVKDRDVRPEAAAKAPVQLAAASRHEPVPAETAAPAKLAVPAKPVVLAASALTVKPAVARPVIVGTTGAKPAKTVEARPAATGQVAAKPAAAHYAVVDGDTLWAVARRLGVSSDALAAANPGVDPRHLTIGQSLALPDGASPAPAATLAKADAPAVPSVDTHIVAEGDNFWNVARRHNITVAALTAANPGIDPTRLRIGQELALPHAGDKARRLASGKTGDGRRYIVDDGDNFWTIAHELGIDVEQLTRANASVDPQKLQPGQVLSLPVVDRAEGGAGTPGETAGLYPVAKGDTLWELSRRFGVNLDTLLSCNDEIDPARLRVGQLLTIPTEGPVASAESLAFPVSPGDTLWTIARRFDISVSALLAANPGVDPLRLQAGQTLRVPSSLAAVAATGATGSPSTASVAAPQAAARPAGTPASNPTGIDATTRLHTVSEGDTLWDLSRRYGVRVSDILAENAGLDPMHLRVGQQVHMPGGAVAMAAR